MFSKNKQPTKKKICLISSSGGHFEQLKMLKDLDKFFELIIVTEKTKYNKADREINYFIPQLNRKEPLIPFKLLVILLKSLTILTKEHPSAVISTGALATIPMIILAKKMKIKTIFIESFAKINSPTKTGNFIYKKGFADQFYVQWKSMLKYYPEAIFKGGVY